MLKKKSTGIGGLVVFVISLIISLLNANFKALGFADAAEFALVNDLTGIAHAPGFPSYILLSKLFTSFCALFGMSHVASLVFFSSFCMGIASLLLFHSTILLLKNTYSSLSLYALLFIAVCTALAPVTGTTIWHWSHSVEVYSFQIMCTGLVIYGLFLKETGEKKWNVLIIAIGLGLGLTNHHLTMVLLFPSLLLLWPKGWLVKKLSSNKKEAVQKTDWKELMSKETKQLAFITAGIVLLFYGWMYFRASAELAFAFGSPDTLDRLWYHLSGGAWIKNTQTTVKGIAAMRLPYFLKISFEQFFLFSIFILMGIFYLASVKKHRLWLAVTAYFVILFIYQIRIDQTADTDAYMCTAFYFIGITAALGMARVSTWHAKASLLFPALLMIQVGVHYSKTSLKTFDLSTALMRDLDRSIEKGSIVVIADWTNVINYQYARIKNGFRKDLCVLNYDIKFTHYDLFRRNHPEVYKAVKKSYDQYIFQLEKYHPEEIYNTGCTLDQPELLNAFLQVMKDLQKYCAENNLAFVADPKAYVFLSQQNVFPNPHISGGYVSSREGIGNDDFLKFDHEWIDNEHARWDPSAGDKLVDLEAAMDFQRMYWKQQGDSKRENLAEMNYRKIKQQQNKMKKKMKFLFRRAT